MKAISECIYERGKHGMKYVRRRIPVAIRPAYPPKQTHIIRSLGTSDLRAAKSRSKLELAKIEIEFQQKRQQLDLCRASVATTRVSKLSDDQLKSVAEYWMRNVLLNDEQCRQQGLNDGEFDSLGEELNTQRAVLGRMLAQGKTMEIFPALHSVMHLCGLDFEPDQAEARRASFVFLRNVVETLDHQISRQQGNSVDTDVIAPETQHPLYCIAPERAPSDARIPTWDSIFENWRDYVQNRPQSTTIASLTAWRGLHNFMTLKGGGSPASVTPELMTEFVQEMRGRNLAVITINERLRKIRAIYKIGVGKHLLVSNPAANTLGIQENNIQKRQKRRFPFNSTDLALLFESEIFTQHTRSHGQSGEASYWIPVLMFYTGARPEELAGLALCDLHKDPTHGWYFNLVDHPDSAEDCELFDDIPSSHRRTLKNAPSIRRVPVAQELIDLGLLRYVEWVRSSGDTVFFPTLKKDWHGKLSGSFSKFFGRYKRSIGINDGRKVLYSFRHNMKDFLEIAGFPTKYLKRFLGHTSGDGKVTDTYGSDLPFERMAGYFKGVEFPAIPAKSWQPGQGFISLKS